VRKCSGASGLLEYAQVVLGGGGGIPNGDHGEDLGERMRQELQNGVRSIRLRLGKLLVP